MKTKAKRRLSVPSKPRVAQARSQVQRLVRMHWSDRIRRAEEQGRPLYLKPGDVAGVKHLLDYYELHFANVVAIVCANGSVGKTYAS